MFIFVERVVVVIGEVVVLVGFKVIGIVNGVKESNCVELGVVVKKVKDVLFKIVGVELFVVNCVFCLIDNF